MQYHHHYQPMRETPVGGILCNEADSVIEIAILNSDKELGELSKSNFSSFPNLVDLELYNYGLNGSIP